MNDLIFSNKNRETIQTSSKVLIYYYVDTLQYFFFAVFYLIYFVK